jgi:hypothetical protein
MKYNINKAIESAPIIYVLGARFYNLASLE